MKHGDFTALAKNYALYRPGYSPFVGETILRAASTEYQHICAADVGAGTGIWTRQMAEHGLTIDAVEPNDAMRTQGQSLSKNFPIIWHKGSAENIPLLQHKYHLVTMASSFHWPDFHQAVQEFDRILMPGGIFAALWNTRNIENTPLLVDIEAYLYTLVPQLKRVSSGRSAFCDTLSTQLITCGVFEDVIYVEGTHVERQSPEHYMGIWASVNDVRVQAGEERFAAFMEYIKHATKDVHYIEAHYVTRAWIAKKKGTICKAELSG